MITIYIVGSFIAWVICGYYIIKVISGGEITTVLRKLCSEIDNPYLGIFCFVLTCTLWVLVVLVVIGVWLARERRFKERERHDREDHN